jgi:hypothetical protein
VNLKAAAGAWGPAQGIRLAQQLHVRVRVQVGNKSRTAQGVGGRVGEVRAMRIVTVRQVKEVGGDARIRFATYAHHALAGLWRGRESRFWSGLGRRRERVESGRYAGGAYVRFDRNGRERWLQIRPGIYQRQWAKVPAASDKYGAEAVVGCRRRRTKALETLRELRARREAARSWFPPVRG